MATTLVHFSATPVHAWGSTGHRHITGGAIPHLPQPLRSFFEANANQIIQTAGMEPPGRHYIDIDVYEEFFANNFPHDVNVLIAKYGNSYVESQGKGPWTYANYIATLSSQMAAAKTKNDWLALRQTAAEGAHYIEDMHNPLHLTQFFNVNGVHSRYESTMVNMHIDDLPFAPAYAAYLPSVIDSVFDGIYAHHGLFTSINNADTIALDASGGAFNSTYYNSMWSQTGAFTKALFQEASGAVADGWYTAWVNAGSPIPNLGLAGDYNGNNVIDAADYTVWRDAVAAGATALINDPTPGTVNTSDYQYWKTHFGQSMGGGASTAISAPEPATWQFILLLVAWLAACDRQRWNTGNGGLTSAIDF